MSVLTIHAPRGAELIRVNLRSGLNVLSDHRAHCFLSPIFDHLSANRSAAFQHSENNRLRTLLTEFLLNFPLAALVHILDFAADEGLVHLYLAAFGLRVY